MQTINRSRQRGNTRRVISVGQKRRLPVDCLVCAMPIMKSDREIPRRRIVLKAKLKILHFILRGDLRLLILSSPASPSAAGTNSNQSSQLLGLPARTNIVQISKRCQCQISDSHHKPSWHWVVVSMRSTCGNWQGHLIRAGTLRLWSMRSTTGENWALEQGSACKMPSSSIFVWPRSQQVIWPVPGERDMAALGEIMKAPQVLLHLLLPPVR